jgi:hypothetical protein
VTRWNGQDDVVSRIDTFQFRMTGYILKHKFLDLTPRTDGHGILKNIESAIECTQSTMTISLTAQRSCNT